VYGGVNENFVKGLQFSYGYGIIKSVGLYVMWLVVGYSL
jgi:uncharacterized membrane protein